MQPSIHPAEELDPHSRRKFLLTSAGALLAPAVLSPVEKIHAEQHIGAAISPNEILLHTRRRMEFLELGDPHGNPIIFVHGLLGSAESFGCINDKLKEWGMHVVAPNLYGSKTEWWKRQSVMDAGKDISALSDYLYGSRTKRDIVCCSAGGKDGIAACAALNEKSGGGTVENLYAVSAQMDLARSDVLALLSRKQQRELHAVLGIAKQARLPLLQPVRNVSGRLKQRIAHRKIENLAGTEKLASQKLLPYMSPRDRAELHMDDNFRTTLYEDAASYTCEQVIHSIRMLYGWNIDLRLLRGTNAHILHGTDDRLVHPKNATILNAMLRRAGVTNVQTSFFPDGHLLLKTQAEHIGGMIAKNAMP